MPPYCSQPLEAALSNCGRHLLGASWPPHHQIKLDKVRDRCFFYRFLFWYLCTASSFCGYWECVFKKKIQMEAAKENLHQHFCSKVVSTVSWLCKDWWIFLQQSPFILRFDSIRCNCQTWAALHFSQYSPPWCQSQTNVANLLWTLICTDTTFFVISFNSFANSALNQSPTSLPSESPISVNHYCCSKLANSPPDISCALWIIVGSQSLLFFFDLVNGQIPVSKLNHHFEGWW